MWLVEMDARPLTREEEDHLKQWLAESDEHVRVLRETAEVYDQAEILSVLADLMPLPAAQAEVREPESTAVFGGWRNAGWAMAATVVFAVGLVMFSREYIGGGAEAPENYYATEIGGRQSVQLADGSSITLNTDTSLRVEFSRDRRRIVLERGEAFFEVAPDASRPFTVAAGHGQVTAVGTAFSVYRRRGDIEVTVTEGRVRVEPEQPAVETEVAAPVGSESVEAELAEVAVTQQRQIFLGQGEVAVFGDTVEQVEAVEPEALSRELMWQQGMLAFEDESLEAVIAEFSRFTELTITIEDESLKDIRVDGYFHSDDIAGMLTSLRLNFGIEVVRQDKDSISLKQG